MKYGFLETNVYRCILHPHRGVNGDIDSNCEVAGTGKKFNGITKSADKNDVLVVDMLQGLVVFSRWPDGPLKKDRIIPLPHMTDNIAYDEETNAHYTGSLGQLAQVTGAIGQAREGKSFPIKDALVAGGVLKITKESGKEYEVEEILMHDGSVLSVIAVGIVKGNRIITGSFV